MTFFPCLIFLPASSIETSPFSTPLTCSKCLIFCFPLLLSNNLLLPARLRTQMLCQLRDVLSLKELGRAGGEMRGKPPHSPQAVVSSESMWPCLACALRAAHGRHPAPSFPLRALFARRFGPADPLYPQVHQGRRAGRPGDSAARAVCSAGSWSMSPRLCHVRSLAEPWPFLFRLPPPPASSLLDPARAHARTPFRPFLSPPFSPILPLHLCL